MKTKRDFFNLFIGFILVLYFVTIAFSVYFVIVTSLKSIPDFDENFFGLPGKIDLEQIKKVLSYKFKRSRNGTLITFTLFPDLLIYTAIYTVGSAFFAALVPCVMAYLSAKFDYSFGKIVYATVVVVMIVPIVGNLPSMITVLRALGLYDTFYGAFIMKANFVNMYFLIFYAVYKGIPDDYAEAAYIDGAKELTVFVRIMFPLVKTSFATVMLIFFVDLWNDYQIPLLYLPSHPTLSWAVYTLSLTVSTGMTSAPVKMASCAIMVVPTIAVFIIFRNKLMGNLSMGGLKG